MSKNSNVRKVDAKGRVTLPASFAGALVTIEEQGSTVLILRKVRVTPVTESVALSDKDAENFEKALANPPKPNRALKKLLRKK